MCYLMDVNCIWDSLCWEISYVIGPDRCDVKDAICVHSDPTSVSRPFIHSTLACALTHSDIHLVVKTHHFSRNKYFVVSSELKESFVSFWNNYSFF